MCQDSWAGLEISRRKKKKYMYVWQRNTVHVDNERETTLQKLNARKLMKSTKNFIKPNVEITICMFYINFLCSYTMYMQEGIKKDPSLVIKLRATFLKVNFLHTYSVNLLLFAWKKISRGSRV